MDWYDLTDRYHGQTLESGGDLSVLTHEWQRELAAIWRLEADVNNGTYLQFIENWNADSYDYAVQGLRKIGADKMARITEKCHKLVLDNTDPTLPETERFRCLMSNPIINSDGSVTEPPPSPLPENIVQRICDLSYQFMDYPDDVGGLGAAYYGPLVENDT